MAIGESERKKGVRYAELGEFESDRLSEMNRRHEELGSFVNMLVRTNYVREAIEEGVFKGLSSVEVFKAIWKLQSGADVKAQGLAFSEQGGFSENEWSVALSHNKKPEGARGIIREVEGKSPMLFELPEFAKLRALELVGQLADRALVDNEVVPTAFRDQAYMPGVILQTHLDFVHYFVDGNGRTTEDWMVWWEKEYVKSHQRDDTASSSDTSIYQLGEMKTIVDKDSVRVWFGDGMRHRGGHYQNVTGVPKFLYEEYETRYLENRERIFERMLIMNEFRREMYGYFVRQLGYDGPSSEFERYIKDNSESVLLVVEELYEDWGMMSVLASQRRKLFDLLEPTGPYVYEVFKPEEVIKRVYLDSVEG